MAEKIEVKVAYPPKINYIYDLHTVETVLFALWFLLIGESLNHYPSIFVKWKYKINTLSYQLQPKTCLENKKIDQQCSDEDQKRKSMMLSE